MEPLVTKIPSDLGELIDTETIYVGTSKQDVVVSALRLYFDSLKAVPGNA